MFYKCITFDSTIPILENVIKFYYKNNTAHLRKQCFTCGKIESNVYSKSLVSDFKSLPDADLSFEKKRITIEFKKNLKGIARNLKILINRLILIIFLTNIVFM